MRIIAIVVFLFSLFPVRMMGQSRGGFLGGVTFPQFSEQTRYNTEKRFQAGVLGSRNFGRFLAVQGEVYYSELDSEAEATHQSFSAAADDTTITSIRLDYFEAPGMVRLNFGEGLYLAVGGAVGMRLRCAITITEESIERDEGCEYRGLELIDKMNLAPVFGGGVQVRVFGQLIGGDLRLIGGWTDVQDTEKYTFDRALANYSLALTGRWVPVLKQQE
jgi:hypothetical protein